MNPQIVIRSETQADANAIAEVTAAAFETLAISNHTEPLIIEALRAAKALWWAIRITTQNSGSETRWGLPMRACRGSLFRYFFRWANAAWYRCLP